MSLTAWTKRIIIICIGIIGIMLTVGWSWGSISPTDVKTPLIAIVTGFFAILKGSE